MTDNTTALTTHTAQPPATRAIETAVMEQVLIGGDLAKLTADQRLDYYNAVCDVLGLNPLTGPFTYLKLNGKLVLYPNKTAAEQLRVNRGISITDLRQTTIDDVILVTVTGQDASGRRDVATGAVSMVYPNLVTEWVNGNKVTKAHPKAGQKIGSEDLAFALMKAETKAKRRLTLSLCGFADATRRLLSKTADIDEDEAQALAVNVDLVTGEIEAPATVIEAPAQPVIAQAVATAPKTAQPVPEDEARARRVAQVHIMCKQLFGDKADEARAWLADQVSKGATKSTRELMPEELSSAVQWLESTAVKRGWTRDAQGHLVPPGEVQEPPQYNEAMADLFGDE